MKRMVSKLPTDTDIMMALSQIAYLNPPYGWKPERPLSELLTFWENCPETKANRRFSQDVIDTLRDAIRNNPNYSNIKVAGHKRCEISGMDAYCFKTNDGKGILAFRGTECFKNEGFMDGFRDAITSTATGDNLQFLAAIAFVREMQRKGITDMRATGHSLGGKIAEYVTLFFPGIRRCDVFNPKNFSRKFVLDNRRYAENKDMNRYVTYKDGEFVGGYEKAGRDWCKDDPDRNFGKGKPIDGEGHDILRSIKKRRDAINNDSTNHLRNNGSGGSGMRIIVSIPELRRKVAQFKEHQRELEKFLRDLNRAISLVSTVAWVSPLSLILLKKFKRLYKTVETSLRIVEKYIFDLEEAIRLYIEAENRAKQRVGSLKTDVFGT
jgi:hypothetical protein